MSAEAIPYPDGGVGALVLFDVLHHVSSPRAFFAEASRVLCPGGRIVLCEPYIGPLSYPVYKFLHEEPVDMLVDPLAALAASVSDGEKDPFDSNQAIPTLLFGRRRRDFERQFPSLALRSLEHLAGPSYPASGGFSRGPLLPAPVWNVLHAFEDRLPASLFRLIGFRLLAVIERR
jgi:SAM-dependent methyltransferase